MCKIRLYILQIAHNEMRLKVNMTFFLIKILNKVDDLIKFCFVGMFSLETRRKGGQHFWVTFS